MEVNYEKLARNLVLLDGGNPDQLVQLGRPEIYGTSAGPAYGVNPEGAKPLWTFYMGAARAAIEVVLEAGVTLDPMAFGQPDAA